MKPIYVLIGAVALIILLVFLVLGFKRPSNSDKLINSTNNIVLADYADKDVVLTYTINGPIRGEEDHRAIRITITKNSRMVEVIKGYQGSLIKSHSIANNSQAFRAFLAAVQNRGYLKERSSTIQSPEGQCPLGNQYIFTTGNVKDAPKILWATNCSTARGTFGGVIGDTQQLFKLQIPDYSKLVGDVRL